MLGSGPWLFEFIGLHLGRVHILIALPSLPCSEQVLLVRILRYPEHPHPYDPGLRGTEVIIVVRTAWEIYVAASTDLNVTLLPACDTLATSTPPTLGKIHPRPLYHSD
jgi:hypothetical protein